MRITPAILACMLASAVLGAAVPRPASAQYGPAARIWVENDRDYFRHGDRLRVNFSTSANSYVAVVHVDPDGYLDFIYPRSPWDDEFVRGGRVYSVDRAGWSNGLLVRGGNGIGYLYVIASPVPLDYSHFRAGRGGGWDWSYAGRRVSGDPFWAMEQITRLLLPGWGQVPHTADYYTYHVGRNQRYPSYACADYAGAYGWGYSPAWTSYYGACGRLDRFLSDNPYYFDSRRYRGDRRRYYRDYRDQHAWDPSHAYKADPRGSAASPEDRRDAPGTERDGWRTGSRAVERPAARTPQRAGERAPASSTPERVTPRPTERPAAQPSPATPSREATPRRARPAPDAPAPAAARSAGSTARSASAAPAPSRPAARRARAEPAQRGTPRVERPGSRSDSRGSSPATPRSRRSD